MKLSHRKKGERKGCMQERLAEHAWKEHHPIRWQETRVIDRVSRTGELRLSQGIEHDPMTSVE